MPTPSELPESSIKIADWSARTDTPKRSVFGNYRAADSSGCAAGATGSCQPEPAAACAVAIESAIDLSMARSFVYHFLTIAYQHPAPAGWQWLCAAATQTSLQSACQLVTPGQTDPVAFTPAAFDSFLNAYLSVFGHAARGSCPLNEIEYGDIKADPLFQPHRLADLAAFYRAFGLEISAGGAERHDHLCIELEFMCVLSAKEAFALKHHLDSALLAQGRDAQKKFLREHLGRWTPAFTRRLESGTNNATLRSLAEFTRTVIESECMRFGVNPGSEELLLRPVDESGDRMCDSCGLNNLPPGAGGDMT